MRQGEAHVVGLDEGILVVETARLTVIVPVWVVVGCFGLPRDWAASVCLDDFEDSVLAVTVAPQLQFLE